MEHHAAYWLFDFVPLVMLIFLFNFFLMILFSILNYVLHELCMSVGSRLGICNSVSSHSDNGDLLSSFCYW